MNNETFTIVSVESDGDEFSPIRLQTDSTTFLTTKGAVNLAKRLIDASVTHLKNVIDQDC